MPSEKRFVYCMRCMSIVVALAIFMLSSRSKLPLPDSALFPGMDKVLHALAFGCFAFAFSYWLGRDMWKSKLAVCVLIVCIAAACYGASDEIHQIFVPGRDASVYDWIADCTGAFAASLLRTTIVRRKKDAAA
ncbi:VanZ family protein [Treponema sp. Marseille-Q4130]|uniref:VanZ family protein n=1 Tax=Treponema sp. Marseille-Q4130 TaxID=2766702 RepID=UPI001651BBCE|nr:VanZ family protein [Treponema sp. Marseille-Q4130]MBC6719733.1 VanZ family protein [Treponema sp. Marseille-Q4130]